ncbi:DUF3499 domain-containing protein [Gordonia sp. ABSL1-1]|uniref:DUF3499 domain-containing protein n=1 Tax=Gordonia sp. ABSL1-1 TaxID=3053923 RepID=UPI002573EDC1|nr:DUF3499 domain-containing protein [Gordonia sp. ABSL1-1]MDL9935654.1 DUF3499 domain-containing protein [Gordonia sp. ABSL1-1]
MKLPRQCCRPGCARSAVATLTFVYAESTAVIGPLATADEPHSWDLCDDHARRITVPRGWEMLRSERGFSAPLAEDHELTALAEAVREAGVAAGGRGAFAEHTGYDRGAGYDRAGLGPRTSAPDLFDGLDDDARPGRHRANGPVDESVGMSARAVHKPRPGRRGHLRVLPDPVD